MPKPRVFGADYSVYVRSVRLALEEKGIDYELEPVDVFAASGPPASHLERQPFGRIPAFEHGDFRLYETGAITRYIDEAFAGPRLQPIDLRHRARMNQIVSIADSYLYPTLVWGIYVEQVSKPRDGISPDAARLASALAKAPVCLQAVAELMGDALWLAGPALSLADLYVAPMLHYFLMSPQGSEMMRAHDNLSAWWSRMDSRPSMARTRPAAPG
jgi:glutathione S-transferase